MDPVPPTHPATVVRRVRIRHDEREEWTPDDVSFQVAPGEVVLLLGPSGSGKSTLALALNGLVPHAVPAEFEGAVVTGGLDTSTSTVAQLSEHVAMVFQDPDAQIVTGTVLDEVCFGPENLLLPVEEVLSRAERALRQVGLWERRTENPDRLSGGGRQRLAIACALAMGSDLLVLDEPTANLDPAGIEEVYAALRSLVSGPDGTGKRHAILLVEHNLDAAIDLVDRVVVLDRDGRLAFDGPTRDVLLGHLDELLEMGVWLPVATLAALRLRSAGVALPDLPLTPAELSAALDAIALPTPPPTVAVAPVTAEGPVAVRVDRLSVERGRGRWRTPILHEVSLEVGTGDFLAVIGTNGAGKTTLLQAIAGVVRPPRGRIDVGGIDPARSDVRTIAAHIGFVFQNPEHQFITHTVHDELAHGLRIRGVDDTEIERRVDDLLRRFGLESARDVHPFLLSGGQKRRLSVGSALIAGAPVLALDEPTFGQDRARANELLDLLAGLNAQGTTVVVVTHDLQLVADHASHVAVMAGGRLLAHDTTAAVLGDDELLRRAGLRPPPLAQAMRSLENHPDWRHLSRLDDLPGAAAR
ncbi:ABC transporter ATP-binding protein [Plantibacter flavus]|uniref:ABC transporter ATP-binding protein n=1 Tax=Plantibacter flavus TaxID=150123 RepID=UPI0010C15E1A|nr:ABC transporter ATP-binding protein [Plantibacter flavus]TKJ99092.1 ABC transporter ATP-binding protein [Plantibacter flavus]